MLNLHTEWNARARDFKEGPAIALTGKSGTKKIRFLMSADSGQQLADALHDILDQIERDHLNQS